MFVHCLPKLGHVGTRAFPGLPLRAKWPAPAGTHTICACFFASCIQLLFCEVTELFCGTCCTMAKETPLQMQVNAVWQNDPCRINSMSFYSDGETLATASDDGTLLIGSCLFEAFVPLLYSLLTPKRTKENLL